jgi:hypothetical protein
MTVNERRVVIVEIDVFIAVDIYNVFPATGIKKDRIGRRLDAASTATIGQNLSSPDIELVRCRS